MNVDFSRESHVSVESAACAGQRKNETGDHGSRVTEERQATGDECIQLTWGEKFVRDAGTSEGNPKRGEFLSNFLRGAAIAAGFCAYKYRISHTSVN